MQIARPRLIIIIIIIVVRRSIVATLRLLAVNKLAESDRAAAIGARYRLRRARVSVGERRKFPARTCVLVAHKRRSSIPFLAALEILSLALQIWASVLNFHANWKL